MSKQDTATTLITGASGGIGEALAREFAAHGHDLILVARSADKLQAVADDLSGKHSIKCTVLTADLSDPTVAVELRDRLQAQGIKVGILVNNAGLLYEGAFQDIDAIDHHRLMQVNIGAVTAMCHSFLPAMLKRGAGRVMNLASTSSFQPVPYLASYGASKAYVLSFSEALNIELKGTGVTVTALCPGFTETDLIVKEDGGAMKIPFVRNMTAVEVAAEGYAACMAGKPIFINGAANRALVEAGRHQPRWLQRLILDQVSKRGIK